MPFPTLFKNAIPTSLIPCLACKTYFHENFVPPFCASCLESMRHAPLGLCTECLSICKLGAHPFLKTGEMERLDSLHAEYWLIGQSFEVAKAWKKKTGWLSNRALFQWRAETLRELRSLELTHLVPMPQRLARIRQLQGKSPAYEITRSLSHALSLPLSPLLQVSLENELRGKRQSRLRQEGRMLLTERFEITEGRDLSKMKVLLIDDFTTTGRTLRLAARTLRLGGISKIHAFCLGIRPRFSRCL